MKTLKRALTLSLFLLSLTACEDPYDRMQGEPSEDDGVAVIDMGADEGAEEGEAGETHEEEGGGAAEEGH